MTAVNLTRRGRRPGNEAARCVQPSKFSVGGYALWCGFCNVHAISNLRLDSTYRLL